MPNEPLTRSFARDLRARNLSERTIDTYLAALTALQKHQPDVDLETVTADELRTFIAAQAQMSAGTAANRYSALQQFFKWAVEEGIIGRSPMAVMRPPEVPEVLVDVLPDDKIKALLKVCAGKDFPARRDTAMIRLFLEPGGLRVSEMVGLTVPAVDFDQDVVLVLGKGRRPRSVPFGARTGQALERYVRDRARHKWAHVPALWLGARGPMTRSGALQMLHRRGEQAGVGNVFPHMLRHTAATDWLDAGGQETDAMRLFGWKSRQMVGRYASKTADTRAAKAARRMSRGDRY